MSEADRVFSTRAGHSANSVTSEKRFIQTRPRRGGPGSSQPRMVEVVHVRRDRSQASHEAPRPTAWGVQTEAWTEEVSNQPRHPNVALDVPLSPPEPAQPVVHVMPMWEPSARRDGTVPATAPAEAAAPARRGRRVRSVQAQAATPRPYADPFAESDDGANCIRCGYLVEPAREKRGLLTCAGCG